MRLDGIHLRVLPRELAEVLAKPLSIVYHQSWLIRKVPVDWRLTKVTLFFFFLQEGQERRSREFQACQPDLT